MCTALSYAPRPGHARAAVLRERLSAQANLGFVPIPEAVLPLIASYIAPAPPGARILDPCAGEGVALGALGEALGIPKPRRYANELHDARATACEQHAQHVASCDTLKSLQAARNLFQVCYLNPPFGNDGKEEGGGRLEPKFFRVAVEDRAWVQPGGIVIIVTPQDILARQDCRNHLARCYDDLRIYALPAALRHYREALVFGVVRAQFRVGAEARVEAQRLLRVLADELPVLEAQLQPLYTVPAPLPVKQVIFRDASRGTPAVAQQDVITTGGAWTTKKYRAATRRLERTNLAPLFPLHKPQAALRIAAGAINGMTVEIAGVPQTIKGSTLESTVTWVEEKDGETSQTTETHTVTRRVPHVVTIDGQGTIRRFIGDHGMAKLMAHEGTADALLHAVEQSAPPRYRLDMTPAVQAVLQAITPVSGRHLPGYPPGLLPMQQHVAAAAHRALTTPDAGWGGRTPHAVLIAAEMGCGKSPIGLAIAELLRQRVAHTPGRAFTVVVSGPNHLIGSKEQTARYRAGKVAELPPWYAEWSDMLPAWHLAVLESPADVGQFFRGAVADPHTPRVGFITNSKLSLSSGYAHGTEDRDTLAETRRSRCLPEHLIEHEHEQLTRIRKAARKQRQTQDAAASAADGSGDDAPTVHPMGVSPRTIRHDAMLRQSAPLPRLGRCCPRCGRHVLTSQYEPQSAQQLAKKGLAAVKCEWCNESLGQMSRERDNVQDRDHPLWASPAWATFAYDAAGRRAIPWGERPMSNPRYALGLLIGKRYGGQVDLYIADEVHECKGKTTAIGRAFGALVHAAQRTVGLTGTLYGGKASDVFAMLLRLGNVPVLTTYGWQGERQFVEEMGVIDTITRETVRADNAGHFSGKPTTSTDIEERPGVTAGLAMILQNQGINVLLKHMGFKLVNYTEDLVTLDIPADLAYEYRRLETAGKAIIPFEGHDALGSYLQSTLLYPYAPWNPKEIASKRTGERYTPERFSPDLVLPHHEWLADYCAQEIARGRRVLVYAEHTGRDDILPDVAGKITQRAARRHGTTLKTAVLRSTTVQAGERRAWFAAREADGTNVVLCNPRLVKTGLNLIGWPSIVVLEPVYSLFTLAQAKRRAFRPTQTKDCTVTYLCYYGSMSEKAISIVARKAAAAAILNGDDLESGLLEFDAGMSLLQELAKLVTSGDADTTNADVRAMLQAGAQALKAHLESGTRSMLGAETLSITIDAPIAAPAAPAAPPPKRRIVFGETPAPRGTTRRVMTITRSTPLPQADLWSLITGTTAPTKPTPLPAPEPLVERDVQQLGLF